MAQRSKTRSNRRQTGFTCCVITYFGATVILLCNVCFSTKARSRLAVTGLGYEMSGRHASAFHETSRHLEAPPSSLYYRNAGPRDELTSGCCALCVCHVFDIAVCPCKFITISSRTKKNGSGWYRKAKLQMQKTDPFS